MKKISLVLMIALCLFSASSVFAQTNPPTDWMRVQSDDGEFSIEIPKTFSYFYDKDGFFETVDSGDSQQLERMNMFNAYYDKTLVSVETYETSNPKKAATALQERGKPDGKYSDVQRGNFRLRQMTSKTGDYYLVRQIFFSKSHLYVLTAASREGETPAMQYFLASLMFNPSGKVASNSSPSAAKTYLFSTIKPYSLTLDLNPPPSPQPLGSPASSVPKDDDTIRPISIFVKPLPAYTNVARQTLERGIIRLRMDFSENCSITKISVLKSLQSGLLRQAIFAALRIKFIPKEKDGKFVSATKTLEYTFEVY